VIRKKNIYIIIFILFLNLVGCGVNKKKEIKESFSQEQEKKIINVSLGGEPTTLDPSLNTYDLFVISQVFEGLMSWVDSGNKISDINSSQVSLGQAKSYSKTSNSDGSVSYKFILRDDIKWTDGKPVVAKDFVYSWRRLVDPEVASNYAYMLDLVKNAKEIRLGNKPKESLGIRAIDKKNLEITLEQDRPYFLELCAYYITAPLREDIVKKNNWAFDANSYVTNGPLKLKEWQHNSRIILVPNNNYYNRDKIKLDELRFILMEDPNAILNAYINNGLDFASNLPIGELDELKKSGDLKSEPLLGVNYISFKLNKKPFDNKLVREAMSLAIDRSYLTKNLLENFMGMNCEPAGGFVPPGILDVDQKDFRETAGNYYELQEENYEKNYTRAVELLAKAGYPDGKDFPTVELCYAPTSENKIICEALQHMWKKVLNIDIKLNAQDVKLIVQMRESDSCSLSKSVWIADYSDANSFLDMWQSDSEINNSHYKNLEYDSLLDKANSRIDARDRDRYLHEAEKILIEEDCVIAPLYFTSNLHASKENLTGVFYNSLGNYWFMYADKK